MKKTLMVLALLALSVTPALAAKGDKWLGIQGGMAVPTGDAGDVLKSGFGGAVFGTYGVATNCGVGVEIGYHTFKGDDAFGGDDFTFSDIQATAITTYAFPTGSKAIPFVRGGAGIYNAKAKYDVPASSGGFDESESDFGFNVGGGVDFSVSPMYTIGLVALYHSIQTEGEATNMFTVGAKLAWGMGGGQ